MSTAAINVDNIPGVYVAPESETLLAVMDPVETTTDTFAVDPETVATALSSFAGDLQEIKTALDLVRTDATNFKTSIKSDDEWNLDQGNVDTNDALRKRVANEQIRLWEAERTCANAIRAIDNVTAWHANTGADDPNGYGYDVIPEDIEMPWRAKVDREDHCPKSAAVDVKRFVWDGIIIDIGWESLKGLGGLIGLGEDGFTWDTFTSTWSGMGALIGRDPTTGEWAWGTAGNAWKETGKSFLAWDMWAEDPARALGSVVGNVLLLVGTAGVGTAVRGTAAASRTGQVLATVAKGANLVNKIIDPVDLAMVAAKGLRGFKIDDILASLGSGVDDLVTTFQVGLRGLDFDFDIDGLPEGQRPGSHVETPSIHGSGSHVSDGGGGNTLGGHGSGSGNDLGAGGHNTNPGHSGEGGPGHGTGGDAASPDRPTPPDSPLGNTVDEQPHYSAALTAKLDELRMTEPEFRDLVNTPLDELSKLPKEKLEALLEVRRALPEVLPDTVLQKVIPPSDVHRLFLDMLDEVAKADVGTPEGAALVAKYDSFVEAHPDVFSGDVGRHAIDTIGGFVSRSADVSDLTTAQIFKVLGLDYDSTPFKAAGQNYFAIEFEAKALNPSTATYSLESAIKHYDQLDGLSGDAYHAKLTELVEKDFLEGKQGQLSDADQVELDGRLAWVDHAMDATDPHRGNGFGGQDGVYAPELQFFDRPEVPKGAELWKIAPDGQRVAVALFENEKWRLVL